MSGFEILGLAGAALSGIGSIAGGIAASNASEAQAKAAERQASEERAASQREAVQRSKEARLVMSRQQAVAGASGAGATDPTVLKLMGDVAGQGYNNSQAALYEGESRGRALEDQAAISRMQGRQARLAGFIGAGTSILSGFSGFSNSGSFKRRIPSTTQKYLYS